MENTQEVGQDPQKKSEKDYRSSAEREAVYGQQDVPGNHLVTQEIVPRNRIAQVR